MFEPNFKYTEKIVRNLTQIAESKAIILSSPLMPKWEVMLRREALLQSAHSSTSIEGNALSLEEVSLLAQGREIMATRKDRQEVLNYLEALEKIPLFAKRDFFSIPDLLELHKIITKDTLQNPSDEGAIRNRRVYVGNSITGEIIFEPPPVNQVSGLLQGFFEWMNSSQTEPLDAVIEAGIIHYEIVRIHPFIDGNGRTARVMATLILYKRGLDTKRFFSLDDYYDSDRRRYYDVLKSIDQDSIDITGWLEYFTEGVAISIKTVRDKVLGLSRGIKVLKDRGQIALTERQMKIVELILKEDRISISRIVKEFNISRQASLKEMYKLMDLGVIKLYGKGRGAYYRLA